MSDLEKRLRVAAAMLAYQYEKSLLLEAADRLAELERRTVGRHE